MNKNYNKRFFKVSVENKNIQKKFYKEDLLFCGVVQ